MLTTTLRPKTSSPLSGLLSALAALARRGVLPLAALPGMLLPCGWARADGFIYVPDVHVIVEPRPPRPWPRPWPPRPNFPLQVTRHRVTTEVDDTLARTRVEETFHNPNPAQLEGVYIFPLPAEAAVSGFSMKMGGKEVSGEVLEKEKARTIYTEIVRSMKDPGLLEYVDRGLFKASVFPIPAQGDVEVAIEYSESLQRDQGTATYRYPLDTGKYSAGEYQDVLIDVRLRSSQPLRSIYCPSHETAAISRQGDREARVTFEARTLRADKDLVVSWNVSEDQLAPFLVTHRGYEAEGYFFLSLQPRADRTQEAMPKDLVLVVDTSGSMAGPKMEQTRKALTYCVSSLNAGDRFNIVDFSTEARRFREGLVDASEESRKLALAYIDQMKARGGTNIEEALRFAVTDLKAPGRPGFVLLVTDGEPTIGATAPQDILRSLGERNTAKRRVFVFGVGDDLNAKLLDAIARDSAGVARYIGTFENVEVPISTFYDKIDSPILTDVRVEFPGGGIADVYPRPLPDLFKGEQLQVYGRYSGAGSRSVLVRGKFRGEERIFEYSLPFKDAANGYVARLWAQRKIGYLLEQMRLSGESLEVRDEVVRLSKLHGIITPYTSYLILEEDRTRPQISTGPGLPLRRAASDAITLSAPGAASSPESRARTEAVEDAARGAGDAFGKAGGAEAVSASRAIQALKEGAPLDGKAGLPGAQNAGQGARVLMAADRTFYLQGSRWVDAALTAGRTPPGETRKIVYLSEEYFALLASDPAVGKILSLGPEVSFLWKGALIVIEEA